MYDYAASDNLTLMIKMYTIAFIIILTKEDFSEYFYL